MSEPTGHGATPPETAGGAAAAPGPAGAPATTPPREPHEPHEPHEPGGRHEVDGAAERAPSRGPLRDPVVLGSLGVLVFLALAGLILPSLLPHGPNELVSDRALDGPSWGHPLGTDELGRDLLARVLAGIRVSLLVIVSSVPLALAAGGLLGLFSSASRWLDTPVQRLFDVVLAFPSLILGLACAAVLGSGLTSVIVTVAVAASPVTGRVLRDAVRSQATRDYVVSARVLGVGTWRLYLRHILPNCFDVVLVQAALACATAVFVEGGMSFLGLGVPPPGASLGSLLSTSLNVLTSAPFYAAGPLVVISALVLCFTLLSDALNRTMAAR
ncbi:ABC transporter permease [Streptomyces hoynatensis]|uniref:ABC transporter permease n=1 Tax=Streptomyces hoynatensis TaxID=1141874 RepID=A0A3A9YUW4_9ACTN|nr:ABC transporter permease [Streptomyces hoynatensis]RKN39828.1 ABC transporter permease [Streptomyces hoynatensis]